MGKKMRLNDVAVCDGDECKLKMSCVRHLLFSGLKGDEIGVLHTEAKFDGRKCINYYPRYEL